MVSRYPLIKISNLAQKIGMGPFGSSIKVETFKEIGVPIINGQHLRGSKLLDKGFNYISESHAMRLLNANVGCGDVVFTHRGNIGQVSYIPKNSEYKKYIVSQSQFFIRPIPSVVSPEYLTYYFLSPEGQTKLRANLSQTGVPAMAQPTTYVKSLEIPLPSLEIQKAITNILGSLDEKIELNTKVNEKLEGIAQALFKSWFIDFDPARAKAEGRDTGLPEHISSLFPTSFVDSELGQIPEGWRIAKLTDITEINPTRKVDKETEAPYLEMSDMPTKGAIPTRLKNRIPGSGARFINGDTLIARITPCLENGKTAYINCLNEDEVGWGSTEYIVLSAKEGTPKQWPYLLARNEKFRSYLIAQMTGTSGRQRVQPSTILSYPVIYPPRDSMILGIFNKIVEPIFIKLLLDSKQNIVLQGLRDTLLPKLISGELPIPNAERIVGRYL